MPVPWFLKLLTGDNPVHLSFKPVVKLKSTLKLDKRVHKETVTGDNNQIVHQTINGGVHVTVQLDPSGTIDQQTLEQLKPIVDTFGKHETALLAEDSKKYLTGVALLEQNPDSRGVLKYFKSKLSTNDYRMLQIGLLLNQLRENGQLDDVKHLWNQVTTYGMRDRRIVELAATGYFASFFRPLYKALERKDGQTVNKRFNNQYEDILTDPSIAVFVHANMSVDECVTKVIRNAVKNIKYGVTVEEITIHGTGSQQVQKVKAAVDLLSDSFSNIKISTVPRGTNTIKAEIFYRENSLSDELFLD